MLKILSPGILGIGILAVLAGLAGAYVVRASLHRETAKKEPPKALTVPLAAVDLPAGRTLTMGDVGLYSMSPEEFKAKKLDPQLTMLSPEQIIGRTVKVPIGLGQPFLSTSLFLEGTRPSVMEGLKPGMRAYTLLISKERLGSLGAGTRVDILFRSTATNPSQASQALPIPELTVTLMRGVEILDIYEPPSPASRGGNNRGGIRNIDLDARYRNAVPLPQVTLAVTPEQSVKLQAVQSRGEISLVGWPKDGEPDGAAKVPGRLSLRDVLALRPPERPDDFVTEIYRRKSRDVNWFRDGKLMQQGYGGGTNPNGSSGDERAGSDAQPSPTPPAPGLNNGSAPAKPPVQADAGDAAQRNGVRKNATARLEPQFSFPPQE